MSDYFYVSYSVAYSLVVVTITSVAVNIWALLKSSHAPGAFIGQAQVSQPSRKRQQRHYQLQPGQWSSDATFGLERRAILSQSWLCVCHSSRFAKPGDYISLELAGYRIFLIMGKDRVVRAFHNVCRHRAFPITRKTVGSATLLGCRYHGWTYNSEGRLTKAPQFDQLPEFDKSANSLFEIHTKTDAQGLIHVNLNSVPEAKASAVGVPTTTGRPTKISQDSTFMRSWELQGRFNWKSCILDRIQDGGADAMSSHGLHFIGQLQYYPLTTIYTDSESSAWFQLVFSPKSADETTVRCDAFVSKQSDATRFEKVVGPKLESYLNARIDRHERHHESLTDSCRVPGEFQVEFSKISEATEAHYEKEAVKSTEINPAAVQQCKSSAFETAQGICNAMEGARKKLDW